MNGRRAGIRVQRVGAGIAIGLLLCGCLVGPATIGDTHADLSGEARAENPEAEGRGLFPSGTGTDTENGIVCAPGRTCMKSGHATQADPADSPNPAATAGSPEWTKNPGDPEAGAGMSIRVGEVDRVMMEVVIPGTIDI